MSWYWFPKFRHDVYGIIDVFYVFLKLLGIVTFSRTKNESGQFEYYPEKLTLRTKIQICCSSSLGVVALFAMVYEEFYVKDSTVLRMMVVAIKIMGILFYFAMIAGSFLKQTPFLMTMKELYEVDKLFVKLGVRFTFRRFITFHIWLVFWSFVIFGGYVIVLTIMALTTRGPLVGQFFNLVVGYIWMIRVIMVYFYGTWAALAATRFHCLSRYLKKIDLNTTSKPQLEKTMEIVAKVCFKLGEMLDNNHEAFSYAFLCDLVCTTITGLLCILTVFKNIRNSEASQWFFNFAIDITTDYIVILVLSCSLFVINKTQFILSGLEIPLEYEDINAQRSSILFQSLHRGTKFTAASFFDLNMELMVSHAMCLTKLIMFLMEMRDANLQKN